MWFENLVPIPMDQREGHCLLLLVVAAVVVTQCLVYTDVQCLEFRWIPGIGLQLY